MVKAKKGNPDGFSKFDGFGVDFKCKLIGISTVEAARGDDICQAAMNKLKMQALKNNKEKKEHKQRITVNISLKGIRLLDESTERIDHAHPIHRISFISHDNDDKRTFGYIVGTKEGYKLFAIKSMKEAEQITKTLKELFQEVFEIYQAKKNETNTENRIEETEKSEEVIRTADPKPEQNEQNNDILNLSESTYQVPSDVMDWGQLNEQIQVMQNHGMPGGSFDLFGDASSGSNVQSTASDPFGGDNFFSTSASKETEGNGFEDMYATVNKTQQASNVDFFASPPAQNTVVEKEEADAPLLMNDPFAELKKNINEMHKQNQQQQQAFGFNGAYQPHPVANMGYTNQSNPFAGQQMFANKNGMQQSMSGYQQPVLPPRAVVSNPFIQTSVAPAPQDNLGWTVSQPPAAPRKDVTPVISNNGADPFSFLDNQTGEQNGNLSNSGSNTAYGNTSNNASAELLDFLG